jgi:large subunit ribosomal protein LP0
MPAKTKKHEYVKNLLESLENYNKAILVECDNVGSKQFQDIRRAIRGNSLILMGKNTLIKRGLRIYLDNRGCRSKKWEGVIDFLVGNVGLVFTEGDIASVYSDILKFKVGDSARAGIIAPCDVFVPAGSTGMEPSATTFFQALNIPTKINKGIVEIVTGMTVIKMGDRVGSSEATLLNKLGIKPFSYGLRAIKVFDQGLIYNPNVLDLTDEDFEHAVMSSLREITAFSLLTSAPNLASIPYLVIEGYKNIIAVALSIDYNLPKTNPHAI